MFTTQRIQKKAQGFLAIIGLGLDRHDTVYITPCLFHQNGKNSLFFFHPLASKSTIVAGQQKGLKRGKCLVEKTWS